jgi:hypothetical protein
MAPDQRRVGIHNRPSVPSEVGEAHSSEEAG